MGGKLGTDADALAIPPSPVAGLEFHDAHLMLLGVGAFRLGGIGILEDVTVGEGDCCGVAVGR